MRAPADHARIDRFLIALADAVRGPLRLYLTGGASMVDRGLRGVTQDIDFLLDPGTAPDMEDRFYLALARLKDEINVSAESAAPTDFLPIPVRAALDRSPFARQIQQLSLYYFDDVSQVLAKTARNSEQDQTDVVALVRAGLVEWTAVEKLWEEIKGRPFPPRATETPRIIEIRLTAMRRTALGLAPG